MIQLEIACNSYQSCLNAVNAGANRIELFENLADGGCTPSFGMLKKTSQLSLPIYVMIRPRAGNFHYTNEEIDIMLEDIDVCKQFAVKGIVFGCLAASGEIDKALNKKLLDAWNGPATFHRAIDRSNNYQEAAKDICNLGFERILSSGGGLHVMDGLENLKKIQADLGMHIHIMPGAGVSVNNAKNIIEHTGCKEIHATCKQSIRSMEGSANLVFNDSETISNYDEISELVSALKE
jgi:copper homeostasis protein